MAKSIFTKYNKIYLFFMLLAVLALLSLGTAVGVSLYFGHPVDGTDITPYLKNKLRLGGSFTEAEVLEKAKYEYGWAHAENAIVEVYAVNEAGEDVLTEEILSFNAQTRRFTVVGVAEGYIKFINTFDNSVSFSVPYSTDFKSKDTRSILEENYATLSADGIVAATELAQIEALTLQNKTTVDLADFIKLINLKKLSIKNESSMGLVDFKNFRLPSETNIYVSSNEYLDYVNRADSVWEEYTNKIYPNVSGFEKHSVVLYKNGGLFENDNGLAFKAAEAEDDGSLKLSEDFAIEREGYQFMGWYLTSDGSTLQGEALTDEYAFVADTKLCARWEANTYTVRMHHNDDTGAYTDKVFTYDEESVIADTLPQLEGFIQLGWASDENARAEEYAKAQTVKNLTGEQGALIELYAIWVRERFTIQFYSWNENKTYQEYGTSLVCDYGDNVILESGLGEPTSQYGSFKGWAFEANAAKAEFEYGTKLNSVTDNLFMTYKENGTLNFYAIFELEQYDLKYDGAGGEPVPSEIKGVARGVSVTLHKPIEREGYKFMGWQDNAGHIWTSEARYNANISFFAGYKSAQLELVEETAEGFKALRGVDTVNATQVVLTAAWKVNTFKVTFNGAGAENVYQNATVIYGKDYSFDGEVSKTGHTYTGMSSSIGDVQVTGRALTVEQIGTLYLELLGSANNNDFDEGSTVTFTLKWVENNYTVSFDSNGGSGCESKTVTFNNTYGALPIPTRESTKSGNYQTDYTFTGWVYNGNAIDATTRMSTAYNHTLTATWKVNKWKYKCVVEGTLVRLADGSSKYVEDLNGNEEILSWDFYTGKLIKTKIALINSHGEDIYDVIKMEFDDGSFVEISGSHGFFDCDLNEFVYVDENNYTDYIGHAFLKYTDGELTWTKVKLTNVTVSEKYTNTYSVWAAVGLTCLSNDLLSVGPHGYMFGFGYFGIEDMQYNQEEIAMDIARYGLYTYEDFAQYVTYEQYVTFNGAYLKIAVGKGLTTYEEIIALIKRCLG